MRVAVVGAGATGLAAGYDLVRADHDVVVIDAAPELGGLAGSLDVHGTPVERYYHHVFKSDHDFVRIAEEVGLADSIAWSAPPTGIFLDGTRHPFGTPKDMLSFSPIPLAARLRFAASSAALKLIRDGDGLAGATALDWMRRYAGEAATQRIWEPLLRGKFGARAEDVSMAWLWARIHSRTFKLGYMQGGFARLYEAVADKIVASGGQVRLGEPIAGLAGTADGAVLTLATGDEQYDEVIATVQQPVFERLIGRQAGSQTWDDRFLGATCFLLELEQSFMPDYWLNINEPDFPFLAVVEHTRLVDPREYGGRHLLYVGNYTRRDDARYTTQPETLLERYEPFLRRINPAFSLDDVKAWHFSKAPHAQPIMTTGYVDLIPPRVTGVPHVSLATMAQVYPFDRGQNHAIRLGREAAAALGPARR